MRKFFKFSRANKIIVSSFIVASMAVTTLGVSTFAEPTKPTVEMFSEKDFAGTGEASNNHYSVGTRSNIRSLRVVELSDIKNLCATVKEAVKLYNYLKNLVEALPDLWSYITEKGKHVDTDTAIAMLEKEFENLVGQEAQKKEIIEMVNGILSWGDLYEKDERAHVIYLAGPSGVGKTYAAELLARALNGNVEPFTISSADVDLKSKEPIAKQLFGAQLSFMDIFDDLSSSKNKNKSIINYVEKNKHPVVVINEYDKMHSPALDEIFRKIVDDGIININNRPVDFSGTIFIITSNESHDSLLGDINGDRELDDDGTGSRTKTIHDKSFLNRIKTIEFSNLTFEDYKEITKRAFKELADAFFNKYKVKVNVHPDAINEVATRAKQLNKGARPIVNDLRYVLAGLLNKMRFCNLAKDLCKERILTVYYDSNTDELKVVETGENSTPIGGENFAKVKFIERNVPVQAVETGEERMEMIDWNSFNIDFRF